jgi:hypothetical protein
MKSTITTLALGAVLAVSCRSVEKMIDQGDFDIALAKAVHKISGKNQLKEKYVVAIEAAFKKAVDDDMIWIQKWNDSDRASDWYRVIERIRKVETRQDLISPILPLESREGYQAKFAFVKTDGIMKNAISRFQKLTYRDARDLMEQARLGNKADAREAYHIFNRLWEFTADYLDARPLQNEAEILGVSHVVVQMENATFTRIPESLLDELVFRNFEDEKWIKYHFNNEIQFPDREIRLVINHLEIGPERIHERFFVDSKEIEDGFEYVLDHKGNVLKDSLGNDVKKTIYKEIKAKVIETQQLKTGLVSGYINNKNPGTGRIQQIPFESEVVFEHFSSTFRGDRRALSEDSKRFLGRFPLPFPNDQQMVFDLVNTLKPIIGSKVRNLNLLS